MSVVAVNLQTVGQTGANDYTNPQVGENTTYQATYQVIVTDPYADNAATVIQAVDPNTGLKVPQLGDTFYADASVNCLKVNPSRDTKTRLVWMVQCTFGSYNFGKKNNSGHPSDNPFQWRWEYSWKGAKFTRPADQCLLETDIGTAAGALSGQYDGAAINSAGDVFDPPPERDDSRALFTETQYLQNFPNQLLDYVDTINVSPFTLTAMGFSQTIDTKCAKFEPIDAQLKYHTPKTGPEIAYWEVKIQLSINWDNWDILLVDRGPNRRVGPGIANGHGGYYTAADFPAGRPMVEKITDKNHKPTGPVLLDGFGQPLPVGQQPHTITYQLYETNDFSALGL